MIRKVMMIALFTVLFLAPQTAFAYSGSTLEITNGKAAGNEVTLEVNVYDTRSLNAGSFIVKAPSIGNFELKEVNVAPQMKNGRFETTAHKKGDDAEISFIAKKSGGEYNIKKLNVATLTYTMKDVKAGERAVVEFGTPSLTDAEGTELMENAYEGTVAKERLFGDVLGTDSMNVAQAARILQHANGSSPFSDNVRRFGDVNADGNVAHTDAQWILDLITGKRMNFLHIATEEELTAYVGSSYSYQMKAKEGNEPYTWSARSLPYGLAIDETTGIISGEPKREEEKSTVITVEDRTGKKVSKEIDFPIVTSNIESVQALAPVTVEQGKTLELPAETSVTYKDGSNESLPITWTDFNTDQADGEYIVRGTVGDGYTVSMTVVIYTGEAPSLPENSIENVDNSYSSFLGFHSIMAETTRDVYRMEVRFTRAGERRQETQEMFYESDNRFSKNLTQLERGAEITLVAYSEFDEKLTEKKIRVQ